MLSASLPNAYREGAHLALLYSMQHSCAARSSEYKSKFAMNEMAAFRFIRDHGDLPFCPGTILAIYASMLTEDTDRGWKTVNTYMDDGEIFCVTLPADETPQAMSSLCKAYSFLNEPEPEQFDDIFRFVLDFICIHPFEDGNGRMAAFILQFLLRKAGLQCAVFLPLDAIMNGVNRVATSRQIRAASGTYYGMKEIEYDPFISYMKVILAKCYQSVSLAAEKISAGVYAGKCKSLR